MRNGDSEARAAEPVPVIYDDFSDGRLWDRTGNDPWGRELPEWKFEAHQSHYQAAKKGLDVAKTAARKAELGFDVEQQDFSNPWGGEQGEFYFKSNHGVTTVRDLLGDYLPEAKKRGIKVISGRNSSVSSGRRLN